jgi:hypothetical protein
MKSKLSLSSSQSLFTFFFLVFFFTLFNGYLQNLVAGYRANAWLVFTGLIIELSVTLWLAWRWIEIEIVPLEIAGFTLVVVGVWWYFIVPALPTLLPPTQSSDAVRVYLQVMFTYPNGTLVSWYPAGGSFVTAMLAHWLGIEPLRLVHPVAASFVALSAGAVYGMTCALLPKRKITPIVALMAPAMLFVPWSYFAGILNWEQYFFAQAFAQYFILAAMWFMARYIQEPHWIWAGLIGAALLGVVAAYPIFVAMPMGVFGLLVLVQLARARNFRQNRTMLIALIVFIILLIVAAVALQRGGILELIAGKISVEGEVGAGGVAKPSVETLGGPVFLVLVVLGAVLAWRASWLGKTILAWLVIWSLQLFALFTLQAYINISNYRIDKTFYILVFPFAMLATLSLAWLSERIVQRWTFSARARSLGFVVTAIGLILFVIIWRPPKPFSPLTESEIQVAQWAKKFYNETYQIAYLDESTISAYWLVFGLWRETLPNEWFQWIPPGRKLGPATFDEWLHDPLWHNRLLVRYVEEIPGNLRIVHQIGSSAIIDKDVPPDYGPQIAQGNALMFGSTLTLIGTEIPRTTFQPGETLMLATWTQSLYPPPATVAWRMELLDHAGKVVSRVERDPFGGKYPLQRWPPGRYLREEWALPLDPGLPPGVYDLRMALFRRADGELIDVRPLYSLQPIVPTADAPIARIKIPLAPPSADELRATKSLQARVGDAFALTNYALQTDRATGRVQVTLYWQSLKSTPKNYTVFVHLLDASGKVVAQVDNEPRGGTYPTSMWEVNEIVKDEYTLTIPANARAPFTLEIGMYEYPSLQRLPVNQSDHLVLEVAQD